MREERIGDTRMTTMKTFTNKTRVDLLGWSKSRSTLTVQDDAKNREDLGLSSTKTKQFHGNGTWHPDGRPSPKPT